MKQPLKHVGTSDSVMASTWSLQELLEGARQGLDAHIGEIWSRYERPLLASARARFPRIDDDTLQSCFADVILGLPAALQSYREAGAFDGWLWVMLRHRILQELRRRPNTTDYTSDFENLGAVGHPVGGTMEREEIITRICKRLTPQEAKVWLRAAEGCKPRDIAGSIDADPNAVRVALHRARKVALRVVAEELQLDPADIVRIGVSAEAF
jgi:RNA polymerase sigma factor (sigma-70 family)